MFKILLTASGYFSKFRLAYFTKRVHNLVLNSKYLDVASSQNYSANAGEKIFKEVQKKTN